MPADKRLEFKQRLLSHRKKFIFAGVSGAAGLVYAYESHVQECPVTGRSRFVALYPDQIKTISKAEFDNLLEEFQDSIFRFRIVLILRRVTLTSGVRSLMSGLRTGEILWSAG